MKKGALWMLPILAFVSCQEMESLTENEWQEPTVKGVHMTVPEIPFDGGVAQTKSAMTVNETTGLSFVWSDGDATGVYTTTDGFARFGLATGGGMADATFDGGGFSLTDGSTYYAFYPYAELSTDKTAIPLVYSGQSVSADNDMTSPMTKDYLWASAVSDAGNAKFSFAHIGSFLRMKISLPEGTAIDKVELVPMYEEVPQTLMFDITSQTPTVSTASPVMTISATDVTVPESGKATVWAAMPPQDFSADSFAVQVTSGTDVFSARAAGKAFIPGKAYRWEIAPVDVTGDPGYGFATVAETGLSNVTASVEAGEYSGITYMGGTQYAVVHDKLNGGGIVFYYITINDDGTVGAVSKSVPTGTSESAVTGRDNEGIAFVPGSPGPGTLFVSAEADQSIREYDLEGVPTGRALTIPTDMAVGKISSNKGFEALTYNATTELFWTTTESELTKDAATPGLLRLQSFGTDLKVSGRYLYQMDAPTKSAGEASTYVFGTPALAALDDGRIIVLEREVFVASGSTMQKAMNSITQIKLYVVNPGSDSSGILRKTLLTSFTTKPLSANFANYEGMCIGPTLSDGSKTLVLIPDSQGGSGGLTQEYVKVITF